MTAAGTGPTASPGGGEQAARPTVEVVTHLQAAALEVIAAVRSFLDAAEEVVRNPSAVVGVASRAAGRERAAGGDGETGEPGGRVQRIPVSE